MAYKFVRGGTVTGTLNTTGNQSITGSADAVQLQVKGNGTQTNNILSILKSDNTSLLSLTNAGNLNVAGALTTGSFTVNNYSPTLGDGTNGFTQTLTYGQYIKIGQVTFVFIHIDWNSKGAAAGSLQLSLPFEATNAERASLCVGFASGIPTTAATSQPMCLCQGAGNGSYAQLYNELAGTAVAVTAALTAASGSIYVSGVYY